MWLSRKLSYCDQSPPEKSPFHDGLGDGDGDGDGDGAGLGDGDGVEVVVPDGVVEPDGMAVPDIVLSVEPG
jgi:hypothetical protein